MAKLTNSDDHGLRLEPFDSGGTIKLDELLNIPLDRDQKKARDPLADMQRAIRLLQRQAQPSNSLLAVQDFDFSFDGLAVTNISRLLKLAREYLGCQEYTPALEVLHELLREKPQHPDGLFLQAVCLHGLGEHRLGLQALSVLRATQAQGVDIAPRLISEANDLRIKLWAGIAPLVMSENYERLQNDKIEELLSDVEQLLIIDPLVWEFHYLKAEGLFAANKADEAWMTVLEAIELVRTRPIKPLQKQPDALTSLQERLRTDRAKRLMAPAREYYRNGDYAQAKAIVTALPPEIRTAKLVTNFEAYLTRLLGPPVGTPQTIQPEGTFAEVDSLHFFLVGDEMLMIRLILMAEMHREVVETIRSLLPYTPHFLYLRFLLAMGLYEGLMARFQANDSPSLNELQEIVIEARKHSEAALADPELEENASMLVSVLDQLQQRLDEARVEQENAEKDWKKLKPCMEEYNAIMSSGEKGIGDVKELDLLVSRMTRLRDKVTKISDLVCEAAVEYRNKLQEAITGNLHELAKLRISLLEKLQIDTLWKRLKQETDSVKSPLTQSTAKWFAVQLMDIYNEAKLLRTKLTEPENGKSADQLINTIKQIFQNIGLSHLT